MRQTSSESHKYVTLNGTFCARQCLQSFIFFSLRLVSLCVTSIRQCCVYTNCEFYYAHLAHTTSATVWTPFFFSSFFLHAVVAGRANKNTRDERCSFASLHQGIETRVAHTKITENKKHIYFLFVDIGRICVTHSTNHFLSSNTHNALLAINPIHNYFLLAASNRIQNLFCQRKLSIHQMVPQIQLQGERPLTLPN